MGSCVWWITMKHQLHGDAPERCLQKTAEKYTENCISTSVKYGGTDWFEHYSE